MFLVLGPSKSTAVCLQHLADLKKLVKKKDLMASCFELWKWVVEELANEFRKVPSEYTSRLFTMPNGLYMFLCLGNEDFSRLISRTSLISGMGGSIIGGGKGGTCLLFASHGFEASDLKQITASINPLLTTLPRECLKTAAGARLIKPKKSYLVSPTNRSQ